MNFLQELETVLKDDERFVSQDGQLLKPRVQDAVTQLDAQLIRQLMAAPALKEHFFKSVDGITIFDQEKFMWVVNSKEFLPDSYTSYRNKIGLSANDHELLTSSNEVSLVWPYKDCVLEGGQDKEDEKRDEIFYNETLAPDEVGRLLAPKAFRNATRYTADGEEHVTEFDENHNLIIKGNNLLALSSLLERYEGQVKCIYIDPPYNTGTDSFGYNDRFNHSTWLTFMQNRLRIAVRLLARDGVLAVQCDDHEQAYLKVLLDHVIPNGFINCVAVKMSEASGVKMSHTDKRLPKLKEYILLYAPGSPNFNDIRVDKEGWDDEYATLITNLDEKELAFIKTVMDDPERSSEAIAEVQTLLDKAGYERLSETYRRLGLTSRSEIEEFNFSNAYRIFQTASMGGGTTASVNESREKYKKNIFFAHVTPQKRMYLIKGDYSLEQRKPRVQVLFADRYLTVNPGDFWGDIKTTGLDNEGVDFKNGKKPEMLIARILDLSTSHGDLVLDFFLGSGTTAAVAHKMGRRYIGVEQMDYVSSVTIPRLQEVIAGEQRGVSKAQEWEGGGSFVYVELAEQGEKLMCDLQDATTSDEVQGVLDRATERGLLRPSVLPDQLVASSSEFEELPLDDQRRAVAELIDKNRLYVNASDVEDTELGLSKTDIAFTKSFYGKGE